MVQEKLVYMIRRKSDGLFSTGGQKPKFNKNGKVWSTVGALKNHLNQAVNGYRSTVEVHDAFLSYADCEVIVLHQVISSRTYEGFDIVSFINQKLNEEVEMRKRWSGKTPVAYHLKSPRSSVE